MLRAPLKRFLPNLGVGLIAGGIAAAFAGGCLAAGVTNGLPLAFVLLAAQIVSIRMGPTAGLTSLVAGACCVAFFMFEPIGSFQVASAAERHSLIWLIAAGTPLCLALAWSVSRSVPEGAREN